MKQVFTLIAMILLCLNSIFGMHQGTLEGIVYDAKTGQELEGANVQLAISKEGTFTNSLGYFSFRNLKEDTYQIITSYLGFKTDTLINIHVPKNASISVRIYLESQGIDLPAAVIQPDPTVNFNTISQIDLQLRPISNAQEILSLVPGLSLAQHAGGGKAEQLFLRGFDLDHGTDINLSVDGLPVNMGSHAHGQGYSDLHFIIPELVHNIDFNNGPYQARVGNFSTVGSVDFRTAESLENSFLKLETGRFGSYRLVGGIPFFDQQKNGSRHQAFSAAEFSFSDGYFEAPQHFNRINLMAKYVGRWEKGQKVSFTFSSFSSSWDASGQIPERAVREGMISRFGAIDATEGGKTSRNNIYFTYLKNINPSSFTKHQIYYSQYDFELYSNFTFFERDPINGDQIRQKESRELVGYTGSFVQKSNLGPMDLESEFGLNLRFDNISDNELSYTKDRQTTLQNVQLGDAQELNTGFYYQGRLQFNPKLSMEAGLRYDRFLFLYEDKITEAYQPQQVSDGIWSPKLNFYYQLNPSAQLFFKAGKSFHSNDARVVVQQNGQKTLPAAYGTDIGAIFKPAKSLFVNLSFWQLYSEQEFVYVGDEGIVEPSGQSRRLGVDLSARMQLFKWLFADADLSYAYSRQMEEGAYKNLIPLAPVFTSSGGLNVQLKESFSASLRYRWLGNRPADESYNLTAKGYFLLDAVINYKRPRYAIGLQAQNLLNTKWNEAQFATTSRLYNETSPVTEMHFTPGIPLMIKGHITFYF